MELQRKLKNASAEDFISLSKANVQIKKNTGKLAKGERYINMDRTVWNMFKKHLYTALQMVLIRDLGDSSQEAFAKELMAAVLVREHTQYVTAATTACGATVRRQTQRELNGLNENSTDSTRTRMP